MVINKQTQVYSVTFITTLGVALGQLAGWYDWSSYNAKAIACLGLAAVCAGAAFIVSTIPTIEPAARQERTHAIFTLTALVYRLIELSDNNDLRVTLLEVKKEGSTTKLQQIARVTSKGAQSGSAWMLTSQGLAGLCYRKKEKKVKIEEIVNFNQQMMDLGFDTEEIKRFKSTDRMTILCVPIFGSTDDIIAILCLDAKTPKIFTNVHEEIASNMTPFFTRLLVGPSERGS